LNSEAIRSFLNVGFLLFPFWPGHHSRVFFQRPDTQWVLSFSAKWRSFPLPIEGCVHAQETDQVLANMWSFFGDLRISSPPKCLLTMLAFNDTSSFTCCLLLVLSRASNMGPWWCRRSSLRRSESLEFGAVSSAREWVSTPFNIQATQVLPGPFAVFRVLVRSVFFRWFHFLLPCPARRVFFFALLDRYLLLFRTQRDLLSPPPCFPGFSKARPLESAFFFDPALFCTEDSLPSRCGSPHRARSHGLLCASLRVLAFSGVAWFTLPRASLSDFCKRFRAHSPNFPAEPVLLR